MLTIKNGLLVGNPERVHQDKKSPNTSGALVKPTLLIVHDTASGLDSSGPVNWLCNPKAKASAHFVVGRKGFVGDDVHQLVPTNIKAWHAGKSSYRGVRNVNNFSIGIEIVNPGWLTSKDKGVTGTFSSGNPSWNAAQYGIHQVTDDAHPGRYYWMSYTEEQITAVIAMARAIVEAYPTIKDIEPHYVISPGRKVDVNPLFPLARVRASVFNNRGPVELTTPEPVVEDKPDVKSAKAEKDENFDYDATPTANLNLRPWPDSPNRIGVIKMSAEIDIERQSVSKKDGAVWYFIKVKPADITLADKSIKPDEDKFYRGFVHSAFLRLVD